MNMDREEIVEEVARALAAGQLPGCAELEERFPGEEEQVVRLTEAAEVYRDLFPLEQPKRVSLLRPGEQLGEFEVVELIGRGATSEVYSARQVSLGGRMVALKVVPLRPGTDVTNRRFEREARLLASLHHPSLAEVYRCGEEGGLSYLAMRLVGGPTLRDRMSAPDGEQPQLLTAREIAIRVGWVIQVAEALEVVHRAGLVHRDVKPANILVERSGDSKTPTERAILVDFGLVRAHQESDLTATGSFPATYAYAAPEQIEGRELDSSCDVFSLGVTLHELLSGETPSRRPPAALGLGSPAYLDPNLRAVIECATDPDPRWRYEHAGLFADELRAWLAGEKVAVRRPPPLERSQRWLRRNQRGLRVALAGALALGLVAILAVLIQRWQQDEARAQRARDAFQGGEPLIFAEQVAGIAPMWRLSYFSDAECRAAVESLDDPESTAAIMGTLLSNVDQAGASEVAAARLVDPEVGVEVAPGVGVIDNRLVEFSL